MGADQLDWSRMTRSGLEVNQHVKWYLLCQFAFGMLTCETVIVVCDIRNNSKLMLS